MLTIHNKTNENISNEEGQNAFSNHSIWIDLLTPTPEEENWAESTLAIDIPTQNELQAIDIPNRLLKRHNALVMTALLLAGTDTNSPIFAPVTFILTDNRLVTVRYHEPKSFNLFMSHLTNNPENFSTGQDVLLGLLEKIIDRLSTPLEDIANAIDDSSQDIFGTSQDTTKRQKKDFNAILRTIGNKGNLNSKVKETLVSLGRVANFIDYNIDTQATKNKHIGNRIKTMEEDIRALADHTNFLSNKINFLLDAALGMINIEQNTIIKFFSVAAVIFMPPTLIASIYGMNFNTMPELTAPLGYPLTLLLMLMSAIVPYAYFKYRGWF